MRILMLLSRLDQTGMTTHTIDLAEALVRKRHDVTVLIGYHNSPDEIEHQLMNRLKISGANIRTFFAPARNSKFQLTKSAISLIFNILKWRGDVIHVQSPYLSWAPWLLRRKFVSTLHVADLVKCSYYKNATHLIAISRETAEYAEKVFKYKDSDITIVNHGVSSEFAKLMEPNQITATRHELNLPVGKLLLTLVGSIEPRKGHDILLQAVARLPKECKDKIHVVFLGSDKTENKCNSKWLKDTIALTNTADIVSHFEYQDSKLFYKIIDVFILPSWLEGFPLVVIEAMLSGNLCIRTDAEGAFEQIANGQTGFIFPKGDIAGLTEILEKIIRDDAYRLRIAENGRNHALKNFTSDIMAENTLKVYSKIIKNEQK